MLCNMTVAENTKNKHWRNNYYTNLKYNSVLKGKFKKVYED